MWLRASPRRHGSCAAPAAARTLLLRTACQTRASLRQSLSDHGGAAAFQGGGQLENSSAFPTSSSASAFPAPLPGNLWKMVFFPWFWVLLALPPALRKPSRCPGRATAPGIAPAANQVGGGCGADALLGMPVPLGTHRRLCTAAATRPCRHAGF